jgi:hypothetical protein
MQILGVLESCPHVRELALTEVLGMSGLAMAAMEAPSSICPEADPRVDRVWSRQHAAHMGINLNQVPVLLGRLHKLRVDMKAMQRENTHLLLKHSTAVQELTLRYCTC